MLRRTKIIVAVYCLAGACALGLAVVLAIQLVDWLGHPERYAEFTHHHHHAEEAAGPKASPAETYQLNGKTYMRAPSEENDFDVTRCCVDLKEILRVNIDPDKFPDLKELHFVSAEEATALPEEDAVLGVSIEGEEKAYPLRMLNYHVVLNDHFAGKEIAVVYDPLTMTPKVLRRRVEKSDGSAVVLAFGKLSLVYKGGLLLYDEATRSIWWPPEGKCLAGKLSGALLSEYPFLLAPWRVWKERHPGAAILSQHTPFENQYHRDIFQSYYAMKQLPLPVGGWDARKSPFRWSEPVIVIDAQRKAKAYPFSVLAKAQGSLDDSFFGRKIIIHEPQSRLPYPTDERGREIAYSFGAWFLWAVRCPDIEIYSPQTEGK